MTLALAISAAIAGWSVGIAMWLRARSDRYDRLVALDALQRAEAVNASLRQKLSRKPGARAQVDERQSKVIVALKNGTAVAS
jgi:hypothetical protein